MPSALNVWIPVSPAWKIAWNLPLLSMYLHMYRFGQHGVRARKKTRCTPTYKKSRFGQSMLREDDGIPWSIPLLFTNSSFLTDSKIEQKLMFEYVHVSVFNGDLWREVEQRASVVILIRRRVLPAGSRDEIDRHSRLSSDTHERPVDEDHSCEVGVPRRGEHGDRRRPRTLCNRANIIWECIE